MGKQVLRTPAGIKGRVLMPKYLVDFLESIYDGQKPSNFGERMVTRDFIKRIRKIHNFLDLKKPLIYSRRMVPEYLIKRYNDVDFYEVTKEDMANKVTVPEGSQKYVLLNKLGGMSYKRDLVANTLSNANIDSTRYIVSAPDYNLEVLQVENGKTYYFANEKTQIVVGYFADYPTMSSRTADNVRHVYNNVSSFVAEYTGYACVRFSSIDTNTMIYDGITDSAVTSVVSKDSNDTTIDTYNIPAEIQALDGYGWGINDTCYNYIDYDSKKFIKKVGRVKATDLNWEVRGTKYYRAANTINCKKYGGNTLGAGLSNLFNFCTYNQIGNAPYINYTDMAFPSENENTFYVGNVGTTDLTDFLSKIANVYLYYELATPVETDISEYLEDETYIEVTPGGSITFENEYEQEVPSEITYLLEV